MCKRSDGYAASHPTRIRWADHDYFSAALLIAGAATSGICGPGLEPESSKNHREPGEDPTRRYSHGEGAETPPVWRPTVEAESVLPPTSMSNR